MSKATDYVRSWIKQEELKVQAKKTESSLFGEKLKQESEPELIISEVDKMRIDIEVNKRMQIAMRAEKNEYMKSEQQIRQEVLEQFKRGEL